MDGKHKTTSFWELELQKYPLTIKKIKKIKKGLKRLIFSFSSLSSLCSLQPTPPATRYSYASDGDCVVEGRRLCRDSNPKRRSVNRH
jgi:hypothetical protein